MADAREHGAADAAIAHLGAVKPGQAAALVVVLLSQIGNQPVPTTAEVDDPPDVGRAVLPIREGHLVRWVLAEAARLHGVEVADVLTTGSRKTPATHAAHVAMYVLRAYGLTFPKIAEHLARRNHTTVLIACRSVERTPAKMMAAVAILDAADQQEEKTA